MLYAVLLALLNPLSAALGLGLASRLVRRRPLRRGLAAAALTVVLLGSNGWVATAIIRGLELQYLPPDGSVKAQAIVVLSGGERMPFWPRPSLDLNDAGDRLIYGALLYRHGAAPRVICTGAGIARNMAAFLVDLGLPREAVTSETASFDTHDHAVNLCPLLKGDGISRILLVTSATHMPRAMGVFRKACPDLTVVPAPTDYRRPVNPDDRWPGQAITFLPSVYALAGITEAMHEYVGYAYYRLRGWL
ncbi:MAG: YdcF family protein [Vicinamibacterales bacterium]